MNPAFPKSIRDLVQCFSTTSPVCSYFPPVGDFLHIRLLSHVATTIGDQSEAMMCIQAVSPVIFAALTAIKHSKLPTAWSNLFALLEEIKSRQMYHSHYFKRDYQHVSCVLFNGCGKRVFNNKMKVGTLV